MTDIVGILLAAGASSRYEDGNKLLETYRDRPLLEHTATSLQVDEIGRVIAIVGHEHERITTVLEDAGIDDVRFNPSYEAGLSSSVMVGTDAARSVGADAAMFLPGDMPCVDPSTVSKVATTFDRGHGSVIVPTYESMRGNPVLFGADHFGDLSGMAGDVGGRQLFDALQPRPLAVDDPGILIDIDTKEEFSTLRVHGCTEQLV